MLKTPFNHITVLKSIDINRLEQLKNDIDKLHLRFPITTISQKMGINKGNVSSYISGRVPLSDNFLKKFYAIFGQELGKIATQETSEQASAVEEPGSGYTAANSEGVKNQDWEREKERLKNIEYQLATIAKILKTMLNRQSLTEEVLKHRISKPAKKHKKKPGG